MWYSCFYSLFCSICFSISNKVCFVLIQRSVIISHIFIINDVIFFKTPETSKSIRTVVTILDQIVHKHLNINKICIINKSVIDSCSTIFKWCTIFKCYLCSCSELVFSLRLSTGNRTSRDSNSSCNSNISCN